MNSDSAARQTLENKNSPPYKGIFTHSKRLDTFKKYIHRY